MGYIHKKTMDHMDKASIIMENAQKGKLLRNGYASFNDLMNNSSTSLDFSKLMAMTEAFAYGAI